jgi:hypothetical protein
MLAHEASSANNAKEHLCATVIVGNPPYAGHSANNNLPGVVTAVQEYNKGYPDLLKPGQGKWLQNDYVKFIRFSELRILSGGAGVLGFITDNSYLDNPTFKGMRGHLRKSFPYMRIVDLHGNSKKKEKALDGSKDESVFRITQGTAIGLFAHGAVSTNEKCLDILGTEAAKVDAMLQISLQKEALVQLVPNKPFWLFKPQIQSGRSDYENGWDLPLIFSPNGDPAPGIVTTHDEFAISWTVQEAKAKVEALLATSNEIEARELFQLCTTEQWKYANAKASLSDGSWKKKIIPILYRPFDTRITVYDSHVTVHRRERVTSHFLSGKNLGISCTRAIEIQGNFQHVFCTSQITGLHTVSLKEINYLFPVWRYNAERRSPNLAPTFLIAVQSALNLSSTDYRPEDSNAPLNAEKIFHYLYAVLHSPAYRQRYAAFLRTDFPRIPIPGSLAVFNALAALGEQLVQWHLLEHPDAIKIEAACAHKQGAVVFFGTDFELKKVAEKGKELAEPLGGVGKVYINATSGFENVHQPIWQHTIGGYQVLHKWLDDRRKAKRSLSQDDITHWLRIYASLEATQKLMLQVDEAIVANGGWPGEGKNNAQCAFSQNHPPPDAATLAAEQMVQKEQLKAQKKDAASKKKSAVSSTGLLNFGDDLDELAEASGAPPRPKSRATSAKAAGGKASTNTARPGDITDWQAMCAIRAVLARECAINRQNLIRHTARELGIARTSPRIAQELESAVRRAVRRGIASNEGGTLSLAIRKIEDYDRAFLKQHLLSCLSKTWCDKADVPLRFARTLGFARTGPKIAELVSSLLRALLRTGQLEMQGRGAASSYRKSPH